MSKEREGFNFYKSYYTVFKELDPKDKIKFIEALLEKQFEGIEPTKLNGMAKFAYLSQKFSIDKQVKGWEDKTGCKLTSCHPRQGGVETLNDTPTEQVQEEEQVQVQVQVQVKEEEEEEETQKTQQVILEPKKPDNVNVTVNVTDNVNVKDINKTLMSEIEISDVTEEDNDYFKVANSFYELFKTNAQTLGVRWTHLETLRYKEAVTPIRLLITKDERTIEELRLVFSLLEKDEFWMQNIQSTSKLRKQFDQLITKAKNYGKQSRNGKPVQTYDQSVWDQYVPLDEYR